MSPLSYSYDIIEISYTVQYFKEKHAICGYILFFYTAHIIEKDGIILIIGALIPLKCVDDFSQRVSRHSFLNKSDLC
jgi:hypothetical protein